MLPQSSCNSCNLYLHLFIDTCNPNLNIDLLLTVIVTGWISWSLIWTNYLFWKIEEKEYLKRTSLWDLLICHIVVLSDRMSAHNILLRLNVPAYNMVISGHFDQRWILAGVPGATECQPGWCHSQLCRSQRSVTLNSSSSSSCSNTLPLWYILQIKHLRWYPDLFDTWTWEWVGFVLRLKRLQQRTKGLWLVIGHRTGFDAIGRVEWARLMLVAGYDLVSP